MLIKILLIAAVLVIAYYLVRSTAKSKNVALRRLLLAVFVLLAVISIIFPDVTTKVAGFLGVGRGTDLLLYCLVIAFLSYAVVTFRRINILEWRISELARELSVARSHPQNLLSKTSPFKEDAARDTTHTTRTANGDAPAAEDSAPDSRADSQGGRADSSC
ncbi:MAG: DUF2304 domain-containing protein [Actinomycetaceae bacterium]|nr:DUF2304 domain-containing protein [Actinomycetaceae bacterium]MDY6082321.1 DUF2304 domain-containing protein [Actinomycetaceae bacterium]